MNDSDASTTPAEMRAALVQQLEIVHRELVLFRLGCMGLTMAVGTYVIVSLAIRWLA